MLARFTIKILAFAVIFALWPQLAPAQISLTISDPKLFLQPGQQGTYFGTFTNTSATDSYQIIAGQTNDAFFTPDFTQLPVDTFSLSEVIFQSPVRTYAPGDTFTGAIMFVAPKSTAAEGTYTQFPGQPIINYNIRDVTTGVTTNFLGGPASGMSVTVVPEPSGAMLLTLAAGCGLAWRRRVKK